MKRVIAAIFGCSFVLGSTEVRALGVDLEAFYLSDALTATTDGSNSRLIWDVAVTLNLNKKGDIVLGWSYGSFSGTDEQGPTTAELTISEMGPTLGYYFDKSLTWSFFFTYNLLAKGDYSLAGSTAEWRGTSMKGELGFHPALTENLFFGMKLVYYKASFNEQITNSTTLTSVSNGRGVIYPAVTLSYRFN